MSNRRDAADALLKQLKSSTKFVREYRRGDTLGEMALSLAPPVNIYRNYARNSELNPDAGVIAKSRMALLDTLADTGQTLQNIMPWRRVVPAGADPSTRLGAPVADRLAGALHPERTADELIGWRAVTPTTPGSLWTQKGERIGGQSVQHNLGRSPDEKRQPTPAELYMRKKALKTTGVVLLGLLGIGTAAYVSDKRAMKRLEDEKAKRRRTGATSQALDTLAAFERARMGSDSR